MSKFKASFYNFFFGSFSNITLIVIGILMVPYYLRFFSVASYGAWLASGNIIGLLGSMEGGISFIITQKLAKDFAGKDFISFRTYSSSGLVFITLITVIFIVVVLTIHTILPVWVKCPQEQFSNLKVAIIFAGVAGSFGLLNSTIGAFAQVWQLTLVPNLIRNISNLLSVAVIIIYLNLNFGVASIALGAMARETLVFLLLSLYTIKIWHSKGLGKLIFSFFNFKSLLKEILFPFLGRLSQTIISRSYNFLIAAFISPEVSAIYDFTAKTTIMSKQFITIFTNGLYSSINIARFEKKKINYLMDIKNTLIIFFFFAILGLGFSYVFSFEVVRFWVGPTKFGGELLLVLIVLYSFATELFQYQNNLLLVEGKFNYATLMQIINAVTYVTFSIIFIKIIKIGIISLPLSLLIAAVLVLIISNKYLSKNFKINIFKLSFSGYKLVLLSLLIIIPFKIFLFRNLGLSIFSVFALILLFIGLLLVLVLFANSYLRTIVLKRVFVLFKLRNNKLKNE